MCSGATPARKTKLRGENTKEREDLRRLRGSMAGGRYVFGVMGGRNKGNPQEESI
jgi:hypothetical protein